MAKYVPKELPSHSIPLEDGIAFKIKPTANAWWRQPYGVYKLLSAFSVGLTISQACEHAGITLQKYRYFAKAHPDIETIQKRYRDKLVNIAGETVAKGVKSNKRYALKYLEKTQPDKFPPSRLLKKIQDMEYNHAVETNLLREEIRNLKNIILLYREASESITNQKNRRLAKKAERLVMDYNHEHRRGNKMIMKERIKRIEGRRPMVLPPEIPVKNETLPKSTSLTPEEEAAEAFKYGITR